MAAWADDLRHVHAEALAEAAILTANGIESEKVELSPGRYRVRFGAVAGGAPTTLWLRQGTYADVEADVIPPSTPFVVGGTTSRAVDKELLAAPLITIVVRPETSGLAAALTNTVVTSTDDFTYNDDAGAGDSTITRPSGSFVADGYLAGDVLRVAGTASNDNPNGFYLIKTVAALTLTLTGVVLTDEAPATATAAFTYDDDAGAGDSAITRAAGSFVTDGFTAGSLVRVSGTVSNDGLYTIKTVAALTLTLVGIVLVDEAAVVSTLTEESTLTASGTAEVVVTKVSRDLR